MRDYDTPILSISVEFDDAVSDEAWTGIPFSPHLQVRGVPQAAGDSFEILEVLMRHTSKDFQLTERRLGRGSVELGPVDIGSNVLGGRPLEVREVLGGEYLRTDFASTRENGTPVLLGSLATSR